MFVTVALQRSEIVAIPKLREQIVENSPVALASSAAVGSLDMVLEVLLDGVVVQERIVDIDQKDSRMGRAHKTLRRRGDARRREGRVYEESSRQTKVPQSRFDEAGLS